MKTKAFYIFHGVLFLLNLILLVYFLSDGFGLIKSTEEDLDLANLLFTQKLYKPAISAYQEVLINHDLSKDKKEKIYFIIGNINKDHLAEYESAMAYFLRIKIMDLDSELVYQNDKNIIECLERLGREKDAMQIMSFKTDIVQKKPEQAIALLGKSYYTQEDVRNSHPVNGLLDHQVEGFVYDFIYNELLYKKGIRLGYAENSEMTNEIFQIKKKRIVQKTLLSYLSDKNIDAEKINQYYREKSEKIKAFYLGKIPPLFDCIEDVKILYLKEKVEQKHMTLFEDLKKKEGMELMEDFSHYMDDSQEVSNK